MPMIRRRLDFIRSVPAGWLLIFLPCLLLSAAEEKFFPIGLYGFDIRRTNDLAVLRAAGFNCVQTYHSNAGSMLPFLDACQTEGLRAIVPAGVTAGEPWREAALSDHVARLESSPSLLAWHLADEPDYNRIPPVAISKLRDALTRTRTRIPSALVIGDGKSAGDYAATTDILIVDWYPIPHLPLASFGLAVRQGRLAAGPGKPVWALAQAFDWAKDFPRSRKLDVGGFPSETELRAMALLAVVEGASGVFFFAHRSNPGAIPITERPSDWRCVSSVARALADWSPLLAAPTVWSPVDQAVDTDRVRWRNALGDEALQIARKRLAKKHGPFAPGDYLLVVNTTREKRKTRLRAPGLRDVPVSRVGENEPAAIIRGWIEDEFGAYATRVYGPLPLE